MPGTAFWACMLLTGTDEKKAGSCGGFLLNPPLRLLIPVDINIQSPFLPWLFLLALLFCCKRSTHRLLLVQPTVCLSDNHKGGLKYAVLYTNVDGYVYRGSLGKDEAIEWISRMHLRSAHTFIKATCSLFCLPPFDLQIRLPLIETACYRLFCDMTGTVRT